MPRLKKQLLRNSASGVIQFVVSTLLLLLAIPILVRKLGTESYGVFSIISIVGSVNVFANLGLNASLVKFLAEQGKRRDSHYDIVVTLAISAVVIVPVTALLACFHRFVLVGILNVPLHLLNAARALFLYALWANCLIFLGQTFSAILDSQQKIYLTNILQLTYNIFYWGLITTAVLFGCTLGELGMFVFFAGFVWFAATGIATRISWGKLEIEGLLRNFPRIARKQISYGKNIYLSGVTNFFYEPVTRILISHFIGIREVGYFDIALKAKGQVVGIAAKVFYPLFPFFSKLADAAKIKLIVTDLQQKILFLVVPCTAVIVFAVGPFVRIWIGMDAPEISAAVAVVVVANLLFSVSVIPIYHYMTAKSHTEVMIYSQLANACPSFAVFLLTYKALGFPSALLGTGLGIFCSFLLLNYYQKKFLETIVFSSFGDFFKLMTILASCFVISLLLSVGLQSDIAKVSILPIVVAISAIVAYRFLQVFTEDDVANYFGEHPRARSTISRLLLRQTRSVSR